MAPAKRMYWMDTLRGVAVLLVVLQHSTSFPKQRGTDLQFSVIDVSADILASYRMPMLLFLSGILLGPSVHKALTKYTTGKIRKIVWPLIIWALITGWSDGILHLANDVEYWKAGPLHMWFLGCLIFYYAVGILGKWLPYWLIVAAFVVGTVLTDPGEDFFWRRMFFYGVFFFLGAAIRPYITRLQKLPTWFPYTCLVLVLALAICTLLDYVEVHPTRPVWNILVALPGIAGLVWLGPRLPRQKWLEAAGRRSIVIYVTHFPIMIWLTHAISPMGALAPFAFYTLVAGLGFGIPLYLCTIYKWVRIFYEFPSWRQWRNLWQKLTRRKPPSNPPQEPPPPVVPPPPGEGRLGPEITATGGIRL